MTPDVNVLVAAYRNDHPQHECARAWLAGALADCAKGGTLEILPMVAAGFLRVVTNRKVFPVATLPKDAVAFLKVVLGGSGATMPQLGPEWGLLQKLCVDLGLSGNAIPDAWIAAAVSAGGFHLVTFDEGFRRLLRPSEYTLLRAKTGTMEHRARYSVHRRKALTRRRSGAGLSEGERRRGA